MTATPGQGQRLVIKVDLPGLRGRASLRLAPRRNKPEQTVFSATLLLMASTLLSGVLGLVRQRYINAIFGAGPATDAYNAAFQLPDMLSYFLVGGVASISLISMLNRYRAAGDEAGADRALLVVLNAMMVVLTAAILLAEVLAPLYTRAMFHSFSPENMALCTRLTRIILPGPLFFFIGGVLGSRLLVRRIFLYQAVTPLIYNLGIIGGAVFLSGRFGIDSLAIGVMAGVIAGPAALTAFGAWRHGLRYRALFDLRDPAFREWLRLTVPLMIGVSLTFADKWILSYYASAEPGGISRLSVAKNLFKRAMSILGSAAGAASLPFFAALFAQGKLQEFGTAVNGAVSRVVAAALLVGAWMIALSFPIVDLFRAGAFTSRDAAETAGFFHSLCGLDRGLDGAGDLRPHLLRGGRYGDPGRRGLGRDASLDPGVRAALSPYGRGGAGRGLRFRHGAERRHAGAAAPPQRSGLARRPGLGGAGARAAGGGLRRSRRGECPAAAPATRAWRGCGGHRSGHRGVGCGVLRRADIDGITAAGATIAAALRA